MLGRAIAVVLHLERWNNDLNEVLPEGGETSEVVGGGHGADRRSSKRRW